jgi:tRNA (adenine57-N1/adenine58-N1)-methyltransferase
MVGHTGFLVTTRRLADGVTPPVRRRRPARAAGEGEPGVDDAWGHWSPDDLGERPVSEKKVRKVRREVAGGAGPASATSQEPTPEPAPEPAREPEPVPDPATGVESRPQNVTPDTTGAEAGGPPPDHRT